MRKRFWSMILALMLLFTAAAAPVSATESDNILNLSGYTDVSGADTPEADTADTDASGADTAKSDDSEADISEAEEAEADTAQSDDPEAVVSEEEASGTDEASPGITDMRVNLLSEPFGVSADSLRFSWAMTSDLDATVQTAYRIVISQTAEQTEQSVYVYDTGWVESDADTDVSIDMDAAENQLYYWQVQVKDNYGRVSALSEPQAFTTAVGSEWDSSKGIWAGTDDFVFLRAQKTVDMSEVEKAIFTATAVSPEDTRQYVYTLYINGECVGMGPTRVSEGVLCYNTYDVTDAMQSGSNAIGVICYSETGHAFLGQMTVFYKDGTSEVLLNTDTSDSIWFGLPGDDAYGKTSALVSDSSYYTQAAENIDSTVYPHGWLETGFNAMAWDEADAAGGVAAYTLEPEESDPLLRYEVTPQSVKQLSDGSYVIDFGQEIVGCLELTIDSSARQSISVCYGEELNNDGSVRYSMLTGNVYAETWTLMSGSQQISGLNMKVFRYVQISGCADTITAENIGGFQIRQDFSEDASSFSSSNSILNDEYSLAKYTIKATSQNLYVDTQSRERQNYSGDLLINMTAAFSVESDYALAKRSLDYAIANPTWPAEYLLYTVMASWQYYLYSGDSEFLAEHYAALQAAMEEFQIGSNGLVEKPSRTILVDWPTAERDGYDTENSYYNTVLNAVYAGACESMADIAAVLGYASEETAYTQAADSVKNCMIAKLYDADEGRFRDGLTASGTAVDHYAQQATAFALAYGVYSDQSMADVLAESISEDGLNQTSVYATYFLLQGLYRSNNGTLARQILSDPSVYVGSHTWANVMYRVGATLATEAWDNSVKANISYSHAWGSAPGTWLVTGLFGITPTSGGYKTFDVKLQPGGVEEAAVKVPTLQGSIEASYQMDGDGGITLEITVPANTQARILIPAEYAQNTELAVDGTWVEAETAEELYLCVTLGSGTHTVSGGSDNYADTSELKQNENVVYRTYGTSWGSYETDGNLSGSTGDSQALYRLRVILNTQTSGGIRYSTHVSTYGWRDWCYNGEVDSVTDKMIQAVKIELTGSAADTWDIYYRVHCQTYGWLDWAKNGEAAGTAGLSKRLEAIEIVLVPKGGDPRRERPG
ncbi:MAG: family 78 glycoside hydrolase catalytic domain [Clostridiales bacterium]|nr:family 78 glycoside hydrolase catalytic domain [Clostridiales bacterium]